SAKKVISLARSNSRLILHPYKMHRFDRIREPSLPADLPKSAVFHSSYYRSAPGVPNVLTIHDFTSEELVGGWRGFAQHWQKSHAVSRSSAVVCVSGNTRHDFRRRFPSYQKGAIEVIYHGVEEHFSAKPAAGQRARDYVLS